MTLKQILQALLAGEKLQGPECKRSDLTFFYSSESDEIVRSDGAKIDLNQLRSYKKEVIVARKLEAGWIVLFTNDYGTQSTFCKNKEDLVETQEHFRRIKKSFYTMRIDPNAQD